MKAMILAAGKGERMQPLTATCPKPLLTVNKQPLINYHLKALAHAGFHDVVINTWYLGDQIIETIGTGSEYGLQIHYSIEAELLDTGGGITNCLEFLGPDPFLVMSADIFTNFPLNTLPTNPNGLAHLVMVDNPSYHPQGDFDLQHGKLSMLGANKLTYANIGIFRPEFFVGAPSGKFPLNILLRKHIAAGLVTGQYFSDIWYNIGTPADLALVNNLVVDNS